MLLKECWTWTRKSLILPNRLRVRIRPTKQFTNKKNPVAKESKDETISCTYCKARGHLQEACFKLKNREQRLAQQPAQPSSSGTTPTTSQVGSVAEKTDNRLEISGPLLCITNINNRCCELSALLDTGSPVSFLNKQLVYAYFPISLDLLEKSDKTYHTVIDLPIDVIGKIKTTVRLRKLPGRKLPVELLVMSNDCFQLDVLLGRNFLEAANVTLLYRPLNNGVESNVEFCAFAQSTQDLFQPDEKLEEAIRKNTSDLDEIPREKLLNLILEVQNRNVLLTDDDYSVQVHLKDHSTYAYAPRRFAHAERKEIRELTDDLLCRGIIKPSTSPYCARIVPVKKKKWNIEIMCRLATIEY